MPKMPVPALSLMVEFRMVTVPQELEMPPTFESDLFAVTVEWSRISVPIPFGFRRCSERDSQSR